jgi:hypothetical protein
MTRLRIADCGLRNIATRVGAGILPGVPIRNPHSAIRN